MFCPISKFDQIGVEAPCVSEHFIGLKSKVSTDAGNL